MAEDNFTRARLESIISSNYKYKTSKNNTARKFIDGYMNSDLRHSDDLQDIAHTYILLERGINPDSFSGKKIKLSEKDINELYMKIKQRAVKTLEISK